MILHSIQRFSQFTCTHISTSHITSPSLLNLDFLNVKKYALTKMYFSLKCEKLILSKQLNTSK